MKQLMKCKFCGNVTGGCSYYVVKNEIYNDFGDSSKDHETRKASIINKNYCVYILTKWFSRLKEKICYSKKR